MKTYYWQNVVDKLVTKTSSSRKPSILHKRITKSAYEAISGLTPAVGRTLANEHEFRKVY